MCLNFLSQNNSSFLRWWNERLFAMPTLCKGIRARNHARPFLGCQPQGGGLVDRFRVHLRSKALRSCQEQLDRPHRIWGGGFAAEYRAQSRPRSAFIQPDPPQAHEGRAERRPFPDGWRVGHQRGGRRSCPHVSGVQDERDEGLLTGARRSYPRPYGIQDEHDEGGLLKIFFWPPQTKMFRRLYIGSKANKKKYSVVGTKKTLCTLVNFFIQWRKGKKIVFSRL